MEVESLSTPVIGADGNVRWNIRAERQIAQSFDATALTRLIQGVRVNEARKNLKAALPEASAPNLQISPAWWPYVPMLPIRIDVVTK